MIRVLKATRRLCAIVQGESILVATIGVVSLIGYAYGVPNASAWGGNTPMAPSTAICFIIAAAAMWGLACIVERIETKVDTIPTESGDSWKAILTRLDAIEVKLGQITTI